MFLREIRVIYISPDHNQKYHERKVHTEELLKSLGFQNVTHFKSSHEKYPFCLMKAFVDILSQNLNDEPLLIVEDDIEKSQWYSDNIEWPANADAFYLGFSKCGGHPRINKDLGPSKVVVETESRIRIENMLTTHAIVYISKRYKQAVINALKPFIQRNIPYHSDVLISRCQKAYNVYGPKAPYFYQSEKFGNVLHHRNMTDFSF
jgi:hypothetical protein